jgi:hypothetical protein
MHAAVAKPDFRWAAKIGLSAAVILTGAGIGTGLYFANLSYVTAGDEAARATAARAAAAQASASAGTVGRAAAPPAGGGTTTISVSAAAKSSPAEPKVLTFLENWFKAINQHDYNAYVRLESPQYNMNSAAFSSGYSSTTESAAALEEISDLGHGGEAAKVSFTAHQSPAQSVDGSACNRWSITFYLSPVGKNYLEQPAPPNYLPTYQDC